jgi:putative endonuclease
MLSGRITQAAVCGLDWLAERVLPAEEVPQHQRVGRRGEEAAYFYLRRLGYTMVARNFRSPRCRGEIDLIGWEKDVLCFIEVKTRTSRDVKAAEAAVDGHKRREIAAVVREYLRRMPEPRQWRFDVVSVYYEQPNGGQTRDGATKSGPLPIRRSQMGRPQIEVFRNCSLTA